MTPFQHAREVAIEFRKTLFPDGWDKALTSWTLVEAALNNLDLDLARTTKDDPSLGSADAVFDRGCGQILVRSDVSQDEQAFLATHEVGHERLHVEDGDGCHRVVATALRPADGETSGAVKVEAYGARERAELQANVFAREFLLPRCVAKKLFGDGQGANSISKSLGLPLELVRLQLLDALLLPETETPVDKTTPVVAPTEEQRDAAHAKEKVALVVAGPGTGKTTTLTLRARHLLDEGVQPHEILVLTFSNRAARDLVDRLAEMNVRDAHDMWVGTFHAFGLEFLRKHHDSFGLMANFGVADKLAQIALLEAEMHSAPLQEFNPFGDVLEWLPTVVDTIQRLKDELVTAEEYGSHVERDSSGVEPKTLSLRRDVATLYRLYEKRMRDAGRLVDLGDLVMIPTLALETKRERFKTSIGRFRHILVDEYQDVNRASARLVKALSAGADSLWVVGDPRQAIYRFRGASMRNLMHFETDFPKHKKFDLTENYRSHDEIVRVFEHAGRANPIQFSLPLDDVQAVRGASGARPMRVLCEDKNTMCCSLARNIVDHHAVGVRYGDQVVLASSNKSCGEVASALNANGIPALHLGDIFQRGEIKDLMSLLQLLVDPSASPLVRVAALPGHNVRSDDLIRLLEHLRGTKMEPLAWDPRDMSSISAQGQVALQRIRDLFLGLSSSQSPWDVLCELLLGDSHLLRFYLDGSDIAAVARRMAIWQFVHFSRVPDGVLAYQTVGDFLNRLRRRIRLGEDKELRNPPPEAESLDAVAVMTIHGSKGLEFESVHLYDADGSHFERWDKPNPLIPQSLVASTDDALDQEAETEGANRLYVALSRARNYLVIYENQGRWKASPVKSVSEAPHLYETRQFRRADFSPEILDKLVAVAPKTIASGMRQAVEITDHHLLTYMVCARRYYYDHVLGLTPRRSLPSSAEIEHAVMSELSSRGDADGMVSHPSGLKGLLARVKKKSPRAQEPLAKYAETLLAQGHKWLKEADARPDTLVVTAESTHVRFHPHQVLKTGDAMTVRFFRVRPIGGRSRQMLLLRWLAGALTRQEQGAGVSTTVELGVLGVGELLPIKPIWTIPSPLSKALEGLASKRMMANGDARDCVRCRHFAYCPS